MLRSTDVLASMEQGAELRGAVTLSVVGDVCIGPQYRFQPITGRASTIPKLAQLLEMAADVTLMAG